ncbi:MAG: chalcone isomerase family protein [Aureliella sp.]
MQRARVLILSLAAIAICGQALAADLPGELNISGHVLKLNGAGKRTKTFVTVYESGLYLRAPSRDARAVLAAEDLMAIRVKITSSFVSRSSLLASLEEGLKKATGGRADSIAKETKAFVDSLKGDVKKGDVYDFVYVPTKGIYVMKNEKVQGVVPGVAFKKALFGIWLSDSPVDKNLRQAMLSGSTVR